MKKVVILLSLGIFLIFSCARNEQESQVSDVSFTPCQQTKATKSEVSDRVDVAFTNEGVKITHYNFEVTCDFTIVNVTHTFVNGVLNITQQGSPNQAKCVCYTNVSYTINGLAQKDVNVIFINGVQVYCYNGKIEVTDSIKDGTYSGSYNPIWSNTAVGQKVTLELKNGRFVCTDFSDGLPSANGAGTYSTKKDTILFRDELVRCAMPLCDPILIGKYNYAFGGKRLKLSNGRYIFDLKLEDTEGCDSNVIISATEFEKLPASFPIQNIQIVDNCLKMKICSSGCDGSSWVVKLVGCLSNVAVYPPQWVLRLSLENKEICDAVPCREFSFNIKDLQIQGTNKVQLNISGNSILYEY